MAERSMAERPTTDTKTSAAHSEASYLRQLRVVRLSCLALFAVGVLAVWANWPYIAAEHHRLEWWKVIGLYAGDLTAVFWFVRFTMQHAVLGVPLRTNDQARQKKKFRTFALITFAAVIIDLGFSLYLMADERSGYLSHSRNADAQVLEIVEHRREKASNYEVECSFTDNAGSRRQAHLRVQAWGHVFSPSLPSRTVQALTTHDTSNHIIPIKFDSRFPTRAWIEGAGWNDENGIYWFSVGITCLHTGFLFIYLLSLQVRWNWDHPWWSDIYKVFPLVSEIVCMLAMGLIDRLMDAIS
jgi:hypothetical protein